jgi:phosphatidylglycerophosphatase C
MPLDTSAGSPWLALFDLDGTLTWRDTLLPFLAGFVRRHPSRGLRLWRLPIALLAYLAHGDRGLFKSDLIRMVMGGATRPDIDRWADEFVTAMPACGRFRPAALRALEVHRRAGNRLVLLSASPDLYVPRIGALLGFEQTICTEVRWRGTVLDGRLRSENRRGAEKTRCLATLREHHPGFGIVAYGNSASDLDHMRQADRALLVNAPRHARQRAAAWHIETGDWRQ